MLAVAPAMTSAPPRLGLSALPTPSRDHDHDGNGNGNPSDSPEQAAADSLAYALPVLDAFNHRHKNQHAAGHWWASFARLRRGSHALARELQGGRDAITPARWMSTHLVPRCYLTFSQLAADNQYAPLGLLLLSILAHIHSALQHLVPAPPSPTEPTQAPSQTSSRPESTGDKGVAVSRADLLPVIEEEEPESRRGSSDVQRKRPEKDGKKDKERRRKKKDEFSSLFGSL